jgi:hypothetical protein
VLTGGPVVDALWRRLLDRAGPSPRQTLTQDPDLHLLADGIRVDAQHRQPDHCSFALPCCPRELRLVSRAGSPAELGLARDPRVLGVALRQIQVWQGSRLRALDAQDAALTHGFHDFEPDNGFRWTDGNALLPGSLLAGLHGPCHIELRLGGATWYSLRNEAKEALAA